MEAQLTPCLSSTCTTLKKTAGKQGREERVLELTLPLSVAPRNACAPVRAAAEISFTLSMRIPHLHTVTALQELAKFQATGNCLKYLL